MRNRFRRKKLSGTRVQVCVIVDTTEIVVLCLIEWAKGKNVEKAVPVDFAQVGRKRERYGEPLMRYN